MPKLAKNKSSYLFDWKEYCELKVTGDQTPQAQSYFFT